VPRGTTLTPRRQAGDARERILATAYHLFCRHGIRAVGIDLIIAESGVAKMSIYRHFRSKDALVLAVLERRESSWSQDWLQAEVNRRASTGDERLLAIFDVLDEWFRRRDFEGCFFVKVLLEFDDRKHPLHKASREHLANVRSYVRSLAADAGIGDPAALARQWQILMEGAIIAAIEGDRAAAKQARVIAELVLQHAR